MFKIFFSSHDWFFLCFTLHAIRSIVICHVALSDMMQKIKRLLYDVARSLGDCRQIVVRSPHRRTSLSCDDLITRIMLVALLSCDAFTVIYDDPGSLSTPIFLCTWHKGDHRATRATRVCNYRRVCFIGPIGRFKWNFRWVIFQLILVIYGWDISHEIILKWLSLDPTDDNSTMDQVMAWCRQETSHYRSQCWPSSMSQYGVNRPQWLNDYQCLNYSKINQWYQEIIYLE